MFCSSWSAGLWKIKDAGGVQRLWLVNKLHYKMQCWAMTLSTAEKIMYVKIWTCQGAKSFLQLDIWASWSYHLLAQMSFHLAPKLFWWAKLISQFFCYSNSSKNITYPSGKLKTEFTSPIAKSTSHGLSNTTFTLHAACKHADFEICHPSFFWTVLSTAWLV